VAHIERRGDHRYRARYRGPDGHELSRTFWRRVDAEDWLTTMEAAKLRGDWIDPARGRRRLDEWSTAWLEAVRPTLKPATIGSYECLLRSRVLPALGGRSLGSLRPSDVQQWVGSMERAGLSASRIRQAHVVLGQILDAAVRDGLIARNAARGVKLPRLERREAAYFEPEVVERIAVAVGEPYDLLVRVLGVLGLRFGEAAALRRRSVDGLRRRLHVEESLTEVGGRLIFGVPKNHATRSVPVPVSLARALERHLAGRVAPDPTALAFTGLRGALLRHSVFYRHTWRPTLAELGLPLVGVHVLRHSAAAGMIAAGASPKALQSVMGHASAAFSLTVYGHLFDPDLDALADRLEARSRRLPRPDRGLTHSGASCD
jgi:integrase